MFQGSLREIVRVVKKVFRVFKLRLRGVLVVLSGFQGYLKEV